ncbi:hypothetical protein [Streptomyces sp. NPDC020681]|uniref:hypothetical protein n=1 Tax=Streptomyces sp. NPDC020681 TaxID=3365083 RepID=UPI0037A1B40A
MAEDEGSGRKAPALQETDFHSKSHDELLAMIEGTNAETAAELAKRLSKAASTITKVGEGLKSHMTRVIWEGDGGEAFRDWGHKAAMATLELGKYSKEASSWLEEVATAIATAKSSVPKKDGSLQKQVTDATEGMKAARGPGTGFERQEFQTQKSEALAEMERRRLEAADQLRKLGQTYSHSGTQIMSLQPPEFPPPPGEFVPPPPPRAVNDSTYIGDTGGVARRESSDTYSPSERAVSTTSEKQVKTTPDALIPQHVVVPDRPVEMGIDSVTTTPPTTTTPPATTNTVPPLGKTDGVPPLVGTIPPAFGGGNTNPSGPGGKPLPSARNMAPGQAGLTSRMPRESGISGGRPVAPNTGRPTGIPRGTVIGNEANNRGPMGRGMGGMHGGPPMGGAGQSGISGGRRLASETGGVVGGRPSPQGAAGSRPFTPGGSGLVRNAASDGSARTGPAGRAGAVPSATPRDGRRRDREDADRPDYLTEDEETWQQSDRRIVPPVID